MIGHALIHTRHPVHPLSERWVAAGFGISAIASFVVPDTGTILALAAANWNTAAGALCFLIGAVMLYRHFPATSEV